MRVTNERQLRQSLDLLAEQDALIKMGLQRYGYPHDRFMPATFETLAKIIVGQQISRAAATSIWQRLAQADYITPEVIAPLRQAQLQAHGLSSRKALYLIGLAQALRSGALILDDLASLPGQEVQKRLMSLKGIGAWTADNFRLFALGDMDAWPCNDIALQEAMRRLKRLNTRPNAADMEALARHWQPYRGAGALFLWHLYAIEVRNATPSAI